MALVLTCPQPGDLLVQRRAEPAGGASSLPRAQPLPFARSCSHGEGGVPQARRHLSREPQLLRRRIPALAAHLGAQRALS
jgi:hypothetical protein